MKKYLLVCLFCFSTAFIKSQPLMTVGEVYDYNIGDIFQVASGDFSLPPTYTKMAITNKYYSSSLDTVFYIYTAYSYIPQSCPPPCTFSTSSSTGNLMYYTNLNDTIGAGLGTKPNNLSCIDTNGYTGVWLDSVFYDSSFCNILTIIIRNMDNGPYLLDSCFSYFEPHYGYSIYSKGLGRRTFYYNTCSEGFPNCEVGNNLFYFKKGIDSCGSSSSILNNPVYVSIDNYNNEDKFSIYPNPAQTQIRIEFNITETNSNSIEIKNVFGQLVSTIENKAFVVGQNKIDIDISGFSKGLYFVQLKNDNKTIRRKLIKL